MPTVQKLLSIERICMLTLPWGLGGWDALVGTRCQRGLEMARLSAKRDVGVLGTSKTLGEAMLMPIGGLALLTTAKLACNVRKTGPRSKYVVESFNYDVQAD